MWLSRLSPHGSPWQYDTYVPIVFAGENLRARVIDRKSLYYRYSLYPVGLSRDQTTIRQPGCTIERSSEYNKIDYL